MTSIQKIYISLVLILIGFTNLVYAQKSSIVSGYLGKRAMIEYNSYLSPITLDSRIKGNPFTHNINFHYILKRRLQAGLSYENYSFRDEGANRFRDENHSLNGNSIGLNLDWYRKGLLAPVGLYFRFGIKYLFGNYSEFTEEVIFTFPVSTVVTESNEGKYNHFAYGFEYGIRRIFYDKVVFNVGGSVGDVVGLGIVSPEGYKTILGGYYSIRFHVGVGVLLF